MTSQTNRISKGAPLQDKAQDQLSDEALDRAEGRGGYTYANAGRCAAPNGVSRRR
ncbi:MAG: hypothetical protein RIB84_20435 [Sneathiellaceae bacterium]